MLSWYALWKEGGTAKLMVRENTFWKRWRTKKNKTLNWDREEQIFVLNLSLYMGPQPALAHPWASVSLYVTQGVWWYLRPHHLWYSVIPTGAKGLPSPLEHGQVCATAALGGHTQGLFAPPQTGLWWGGDGKAASALHLSGGGGRSLSSCGTLNLLW